MYFNFSLFFGVFCLLFFWYFNIVIQTPQNQIYNVSENSQKSILSRFDEIYQQQHRLQLEPFIHQKQQNHSFRITNTYARENFIRSQETNSFRIPQGLFIRNECANNIIFRICGIRIFLYILFRFLFT